ncbi:hypothetical protein K435DRAFT_683426 [Dendrothele bispora CBS 962.96]|uniref:Uncharacterized protein n=1 Tax=Dendrothele bispora (strain CBS 962.96) TaxID=1314807 RepID=A0A4S8LC96_DENBC|nr:hypothetical protein K435DRAFT_683426 [Dendrothele bispora CBS 962.96]
MVVIQSTGEDSTIGAVSSLLTKYRIDPRTVGRVDLSTSTFAKSVKARLLGLFASSVNIDVDFVESTNATTAILNSTHWIESSNWDGRYAVVCAAETASSSGAVALLIGPDAPLVLESIRGSSVADHPASEKYASQLINYLEAVDKSFAAYKSNVGKAVSNSTAKSKPHVNGDVNGSPTDKPAAKSVKLSDFDYFIFNSPQSEFAQKAYSRLTYQDYMSHPSAPAYREVLPTPMEEVSLEDYKIGATAVKPTFFDFFSIPQYTQSVAPSQLLSTHLGKAYAGSLYGGLASLLTNVPSYELFNKRVSLFEHNSGSASSIFFAIRVRGDTSHIQTKLDLKGRLSEIGAVIPKCF